MALEMKQARAETPPPAPYAAPPQYVVPAPPIVAQSEHGSWDASGMQAGVPIEVDLMGFCWGAFGLSWIWGWANRVWISFVVFGIGAIPYVGVLGVLAFNIWLGVNGHRLAWQNRRFLSLAHYQDVMRVWNRWGIAVCVAVVLLVVLMVLLFAIYKLTLGGPA